MFLRSSTRLIGTGTLQLDELCAGCLSSVRAANMLNPGDVMKAQMAQGLLSYDSLATMSLWRLLSMKLGCQCVRFQPASKCGVPLVPCRSGVMYL